MVGSSIVFFVCVLHVEDIQLLVILQRPSAPPPTRRHNSKTRPTAPHHATTLSWPGNQHLEDGNASNVIPGMVVEGDLLRRRHHRALMMLPCCPCDRTPVSC
jgi:hypothetical protein